jgi:hypothetical protein
MTIAAMPVSASRPSIAASAPSSSMAWGRAELKLLDDLTEEEIAAKLPVHLRTCPPRAAA